MERYASYLAERAKGMRCRSNFYGNTKWRNNHIAVPLTPKEKERAEKSGDQHVRRKTSRECRWAAFKNCQRSESKLINKLHGLAEHAGGKQLMIAYGSWAPWLVVLELW